MEYEDYLIEIRELSKKYNLTAIQILTLQIAASFEVNKIDYEKLKEDFKNG